MLNSDIIFRYTAGLRNRVRMGNIILVFASQWVSFNLCVSLVSIYCSSLFSRFEIYGRNGLSLSEHWANGRTRTFHGIFTNKFPNLAVVQLAQIGVTINFPHALDEIVRHISFVFKQCVDRGIKEIEASEGAVEEYVAKCLEVSVWLS